MFATDLEAPSHVFPVLLQHLEGLCGVGHDAGVAAVDGARLGRLLAMQRHALTVRLQQSKAPRMTPPKKVSIARGV